jgi:hypothetical protein
MVRALSLGPSFARLAPSLHTFQPLVAVQNHLPPSLVSVGVAAVVFSQGFGPAIFLSLAQTVFSASLTSHLRHLAPSVNPEIVFMAGAGGFRDVVAKKQVQGIVESYSRSVGDVFYLSASVAAAAFVSSWGMGWTSVKKPKVDGPGV